MQITVRFRCKACQQVFETPQNMAGTEVECGCGRKLIVPWKIGQRMANLANISSFLFLLIMGGMLYGCFKSPLIQRPPSPQSSIAKTPVTGAAGYLLGGKLPKSEGEKQDADGGFTLYCEYTNLPPFDHLNIMATRERVIYDIQLECGAADQFPTIFGALSNAMVEKYGLRFASKERSSPTVFCGTSDLSLVLQGFDSYGGIWLTYSDERIRESFEKQKNRQAADAAKKIAPSL